MLSTASSAVLGCLVGRISFCCLLAVVLRVLDQRWIRWDAIRATMSCFLCDDEGSWALQIRTGDALAWIRCGADAAKCKETKEDNTEHEYGVGGQTVLNVNFSQ